MIDLRLGDCLDVMKTIETNSIDMVFADLPYKMTANKWDLLIDMDKLFDEYERVVKPNGALVFTASQPFTSALVMHKPKWFKSEWIWKKNAGSNFGSVKYVPMKEHESVLIFSNGGGKTTYNPIMQERAESGKARVKTVVNYKTKTDNYNDTLHGEVSSKRPDLRYPSSLQYWNRERGLHPTQKPLELIKYLIKTFTNKGDLVLDNTMGSATTGIACMDLNRNFIGIEKDIDIYKLAKKRVEEKRKEKDLQAQTLFGTQK